MPILDYFPLPKIRDKQESAIDFTQRAIEAGYRDIVLECPTGVGKTAIGAALCRWAASVEAEFLAQPDKPRDTPIRPGGYMLVLQKVLQDQVANDLARFSTGGHQARLIKSAVEYPCHGGRKTCYLGMRKKCPCLREGNCTYKVAKSDFLNAAVAVTNYAYFLTERDHKKELEDRRMLVLDECHNVSRTVTHHVDVVVDRATLDHYAPGLKFKDVTKLETLDEFADWLTADYVPAVKDQAAALIELADEHDDKAIKEAFELEQHYLKVSQTATRLKENRTDWVYWRETSQTNDRNVRLIARPLEAGVYFNQLFGRLPLRIFMSAFPGGKGVFCRELGLDPTKVAWKRLGSPFPVENRPMFMTCAGSMGQSKLTETLPRALRLLVKLVAKHSDVRGLVHTHSYKLAEAAVAALTEAGYGDRVVYPKSADEREKALAHHADPARPASILVSPSVAEGFDFKGDLARFQVLLKCPWPSLTDRQVAVKAERHPGWYTGEALKSLIQAVGRGCRSEEDWCVTYVLDADVARLLRETEDYAPKWFSQAVQQYGAHT